MTETELDKANEEYKQEQIKEYDNLLLNNSVAHSRLDDAYYCLVEEISAEGFAGKDAKERHNLAEKEVEKAEKELKDFVYLNEEFVVDVRAERAKANTRAFWNQ